MFENGAFEGSKFIELLQSFEQDTLFVYGTSKDIDTILEDDIVKSLLNFDKEDSASTIGGVVLDFKVSYFKLDDKDIGFVKSNKIYNGKVYIVPQIESPAYQYTTSITDSQKIQFEFNGRPIIAGNERWEFKDFENRLKGN